MDKIKITKSNAIINSSYRLSLNELRIVLYGLSNINPKANDFPLFHRIHVKELASFYNIGEKYRGSFYDNIKNALISRFWEREFSYFDEERGATIKRRWLIEVEYGAQDGSLAYHYNPLIKNQLQQLSSRFTSYFLTNVANMKSSYAIRLYELAIMYLNASGKNKTNFIKEVDELKKHFDLEDKYNHFYHFKARVLERAKQEINKYSDIHFSYDLIKLGRSVEKIRFHIRRKDVKKHKEQIAQGESYEEILKRNIAETHKDIKHWLKMPVSKNTDMILTRAKEKLENLKKELAQIKT